VVLQVLWPASPSVSWYLDSVTLSMKLVYLKLVISLLNTGLMRSCCDYCLLRSDRVEVYHGDGRSRFL
jgi:hypothetical protein